MPSKIIFLFLTLAGSLTLSGQSFETLTKSALQAQKNKQYQKAIGLYHKALTADKENHAIYNQLAQIYYELGKTDSAITCCNATLKNFPGDTLALALRGYCYMIKKQWEPATADLTRAFENGGGKNPDVAFNLGKCWSVQNDFDKAIDYYMLTTKLRPYDKHPYYETGYCYASKQPVEKDSALKYYSKAITIDSNYFEPYFNRGLLYTVHFKDAAKGHADLEKSISLKPSARLPYLYNGVIYRDEENYNKALEMFNQLISIYPEFAEVYYERALIYNKMGAENLCCSDLLKAENLGSTKAAELRKKVCR